MSSIPKKSRVSRNGNRGKPKANGEKSGYKDLSSVENEDSNVDDAQQCVICAEPIIYAAYTPCNHVTCHQCSLRQRALYEKDLCLVCRTPNESVVISTFADQDFATFKDLTLYHDKFKVYFTDEQIRDDCLMLLEYRCSVRDCHEKCDTFKQLQEHTKSAHNKFFCLICYNNKKAFIPELTLYYYKPLQTHQISGDGKGFKGHPACKHCSKKRFYSEDELNIHIRDNHERCHICDQHNPKIADYYKNYDDLNIHFKSNHYVCNVQSCLDKKFVVFNSEIDLAAHMVEEHASLVGTNKLTIGAARPFRSQLSTFQTDNGSNRSNNDTSGDETDSFTTKKMRFEERAKHYLHKQPSKMATFLNINESYKSNSMDAKQVGDAYKELFTEQTTEEIVILLTEFSELFSESNSKHTGLKDAIKAISKKATDADFPILGGRIGSPSPTVNLHGWGSSSNSRNSSTDRFPVLAKPSNVPKVPQVNPSPKIRYTTITKQQPKPVVKQQTNVNYKPTYLNNQSSSSSSSLQGSTSPPASSSSPSWGAPVATKPKIPDSKFPPLEKKTTKKAFPRVNPVSVTPVQNWNSIPVRNATPVDNGWGVPIVEKKKSKKGGK